MLEEFKKMDEGLITRCNECKKFIPIIEKITIKYRHITVDVCSTSCARTYLDRIDSTLGEENFVVRSRDDTDLFHVAHSDPVTINMSKEKLEALREESEKVKRNAHPIH